MIQCPACSKLYSPRDLGLAPGSEFRCACGAALRVPEGRVEVPPERVRDRLVERVFYGVVLGLVAGVWGASRAARLTGFSVTGAFAACAAVGFAIGAALGPVILESLFESLGTRARRPDDTD